MKQHQITCPICGRNLRSYDSGLLPIILEQHTRDEHAKQANEAPANEYHGVMGIGGIGTYAENEMPVIPSVAAIECMERMEARARYCRRCGQSDVFDGAMFTTDRGSGLCDDCYG